MKQSLIADTGISVSRVGLGTVKFGRNQGVRYPESFELPSDKEIVKLLSCAQSLGVNLLDTAPAYGTSEERLGKLLKHSRQEWIISGKAGEEFIDGESYYDFSPLAVRKSVERSLKRLKTDYLDILIVHSNGEDKKIIEQDRVFDVLAALKKAGMIRAFGMSTKTVEGGLLAVEQSDVVMVTYNPVHTEEKDVITSACEKHKGVFIKKALMSGHLKQISAEDAVQVAMEFIFREPGVNSVILGTLNKEHLIHNINCVTKL
jgi:aryl-alcohol dehydrogenase-like predicted oxidoreductase